jgi:hypothetical protein
VLVLVLVLVLALAETLPPGASRRGDPASCPVEEDDGCPLDPESVEGTVDAPLPPHAARGTAPSTSTREEGCIAAVYHATRATADFPARPQNCTAETR